MSEEHPNQDNSVNVIYPVDLKIDKHPEPGGGFRFTWSAKATVTLPSEGCYVDMCLARVVNASGDEIASAHMDEEAKESRRYTTPDELPLDDVTSGEVVYAIVTGKWWCPYVPDPGQSAPKEVP